MVTQRKATLVRTLDKSQAVILKEIVKKVGWFITGKDHLFK